MKRTHVIVIVAAFAGASRSVAAAPSLVGPFSSGGSTCVLRDGEPICWGVDPRLLGESGGGPTPTAVLDVPDLVTLSLGDAHACGIDRAGTVVCFGARYGEEGDMADPVTTPALPKAIAIGVGEAHQCAISTAHEVWCWGEDYEGQVDGIPGRSHRTPVKVAGVRGAVELAIGAWQSCARTTAGAVYCWGRPHANDVTPDELKLHAIKVPASAQLSASREDVCSRAVGGQIDCWGWGASSYAAASDDQNAIVRVTPPAPAAELALADGSLCVRDRAGAVACAGYLAEIASHHAVAPGTFAAIAGVTDAVAISAAGTNACARTAAGAIRCWGDRHGLGRADDDQAATPVAVKGLRNAVALDGLGERTCAIDRAADVWCWGGRHDLAEPARVDALRGATEVAVGDAAVCALVAGVVRCTVIDQARDFGDLVPPDPAHPDAPGVVDVAVGARAEHVAVAALHACAVVGGALSCWGHDYSGVLGRAPAKEYPDLDPPRAVAGLAGVTAVALARARTCAIARGAVRCFGEGKDGLLGDGRAVDSPTPRAVVGLAHAVAIELGDRLACVRTDDGGAACWGNEALTPIPWPNLTDAIDLAVGAESACVVHRGGTVECGLPGVSSTIAGITDAAHVAVGAGHVCVARTGGEVVCWGERRGGALGDGLADIVAVAVEVALPAK
ncbi:MAG: hypothetical protein K8W52_37350 [Deltaproteobacteria bacterium]|nr:hypothetical protein [Deltaproteobacteria bacterium]